MGRTALPPGWCSQPRHCWSLPGMPPRLLLPACLPPLETQFPQFTILLSGLILSPDPQAALFIHQDSISIWFGDDLLFCLTCCTAFAPHAYFPLLPPPARAFSTFYFFFLPHLPPTTHTCHSGDSVYMNITTTTATCNIYAACTLPALRRRLDVRWWNFSYLLAIAARPQPLPYYHFTCLPQRTRMPRPLSGTYYSSQTTCAFEHFWGEWCATYALVVTPTTFSFALWRSFALRAREHFYSFAFGVARVGVER